jgi:hypothetical protein
VTTIFDKPIRNAEHDPEIVSTRIKTAPNDYATQVALGLVTGVRRWSALGEREAIGVTVSGEDIWRGNELSPSPTDDNVIPTPASAGTLMSVVSEDTNDNLTGTGVQQVDIKYIDPTGTEVELTINMNGTTPVDTGIPMRFINDFHSQVVGSGGVAAGHIKVYATADNGLVYNMIAEGGNKSLVPHRMIPAGKTLILKGWSASEAAGKRVAFRLRSTDHDGGILPMTFLFKGTVYLNASASGELELGDTIPEFSIVKVSGWATAINAEAGCGWWGYLVDD